MQCEDYASALLGATARPSSQRDWVTTTTQQQPQKETPTWDRESLTLTAQLKAAELCYLHYQAAFEDELSRSQRLRERLAMLLEDSTHAIQELQRRLAKTIPIDALSVYQQKIARLENQVADVKQQIACDREQFLYEHAKWELEKKHFSRDVDELQDVSVKVLKVVLVREKLLKNQERRFQKQVAAFDERHGCAVAHCSALATVARTLMQECALFLVALQEQTTSEGHGPKLLDPSPVKPVQIKRLLRRLRRLTRELEADCSGLAASSGSEERTMAAEERGSSTGDETALWEASSSE